MQNATKRTIKPIIFSTPMVQAILNGSKTQTRRVVKPIPFINKNGNHEWPGTKHTGNIISVGPFDKKSLLATSSPYGKPGDLLWVRETWAEVGNFASEQFANSEVIAYKTQEAFFYPSGEPLDTDCWNWSKIKWKPSIHMPREACRLFLEVTSCKVERLQDITEQDAIAEGVTQHSDFGSTGYVHYGRPEEALTDVDAVWSFETLWASIYGQQACDDNPWVWVHEFKVVGKPAQWP